MEPPAADPCLPDTASPPAPLEQPLRVRLKQRFLVALAETRMVTKAAAQLGVPERSFYRLRKADADFERAWISLMPPRRKVTKGKAKNAPSRKSPPPKRRTTTKAHRAKTSTDNAAPAADRPIELVLRVYRQDILDAAGRDDRSTGPARRPAPQNRPASPAKTKTDRKPRTETCLMPLPQPNPLPMQSELIACLSSLTPQERAELDRLLLSDPVLGGWVPLPGPQSEAYHSPADVLFYGGGAGGGKTELLLGLALCGHRRSILFRREFQQLRAIEDRADSLIAGHVSLRGRYNAQRRIWRLDDGRILEFGAVQRPGDERKYQGRPHDLKAFDEITHFTERQFRFLTGWNRTAETGQRVRVVAAGNPPLGAEGDWVIRHWAPWLDAQHPNPARSGELRWFATLGGEEHEVADAAPVAFKGERVTPKSRCFIRARVEDNPYLMAAGYKAVLQSLPEPLRTQMLEGDFSAGRGDDAFQIVPTAWVETAMARGKAEPAAPGPMTVLGIDVARGGQDRTVLTPRHGAWFGPQTVLPGRTTPDGPSVLGHCLALTGGARPVMQVDVIGIGAAVYDAARSHGYEILALNGAEASPARDRTGRLGFVNTRAQWWWALREALDPEHGETLALPPDRELLADLTTPRWTLAARGIQVEGKDEIRARLGRSPDKGDSLVYAHAQVMVPGAGLLAFMREAAGG